MILAVEDSVSEVTARKLTAVVRPDIEINVVMGKQGKGYLKSRARELNRTAAAVPVLLLADLDSTAACPSEEIAAWLGGQPQQYLLFRFAIYEIESWLIADRRNIASFLSVSITNVPQWPDTVLDPKQALVNLARRSRSSRIRDELVPAIGSTSPVGPLYNSLVGQFAADVWDPVAARVCSPSLDRAAIRIAAL